MEIICKAGLFTLEARTSRHFFAGEGQWISGLRFMRSLSIEWPDVSEHSAFPKWMGNLEKKVLVPLTELKRLSIEEKNIPNVRAYYGWRRSRANLLLTAAMVQLGHSRLVARPLWAVTNADDGIVDHCINLDNRHQARFSPQMRSVTFRITMTSKQVTTIDVSPTYLYLYSPT